MPIYVYEPTLWSLDEPVNDCCYFESIQSFKDEPLKNCPTCGHEVHRSVTNFSLSSSKSNQEKTSDPYQTLNSKNDSPSARAARLAMRHVCAQGCKH